MTVTKTAFAEMAGIDQSTVTMSIRRGKLVATPEGFIDTEDPVNTIYMARRKQKGAIPSVVTFRKPKRQAKRKEPVASVAQKPEALDAIDLRDPDIERPESEGDVFDQLDKVAAEVKYKNIMTKRNELKYAQDKKELVPWELVDRMNARAKNELKSRIQDLPRRMTPRLAAMARSGSDDREIQSALEREIDDALQAFASVLEVAP